MATINIPSHTTPQITIQFNLPEKSGEDPKIESTEEAEAIVKEWAVTMKRSISEAELNCLASYLKGKSKAHVDHFDKILLGWSMRREHENENAVDAMQDVYHKTLAAQKAFQESSEKLLSGLKDAISKKMTLENPSTVSTPVAAQRRLHVNSDQEVSPKRSLDEFLDISETSIEEFVLCCPVWRIATEELLNEFLAGDVNENDWQMLPTEGGRREIINKFHFFSMRRYGLI